MPLSVRLITYSLFSLVLTGCAANDLMVKRQSESEAKIEYLLQTGKKTEQRLNELSGEQQSQADQAKLLTQQLKQYQASIMELRAALEDSKSRLTQLAQHAATPRVELVNPDTAPKSSKDSGPPAEYVKAFGLYSANNFATAIESFESFLKGNPQNDYAANALYWIGECHYSLFDLSRARDAFAKAAANYPNSPKAPDSLLKQGNILTEMKEKEKAFAVYESLIKAYPSSPAAVKAREQMGAH